MSSRHKLRVIWVVSVKIYKRVEVTPPPGFNVHQNKIYFVLYRIANEQIIKNVIVHASRFCISKLVAASWGNNSGGETESTEIQHGVIGQAGWKRGYKLESGTTHLHICLYQSISFVYHLHNELHLLERPQSHVSRIFRNPWYMWPVHAYPWVILKEHGREIDNDDDLFILFNSIFMMMMIIIIIRYEHCNHIAATEPIQLKFFTFSTHLMDSDTYIRVCVLFL